MWPCCSEGGGGAGQGRHGPRDPHGALGWRDEEESQWPVCGRDLARCEGLRENPEPSRANMLGADLQRP
ncbi:hypothetical protein MC885_003229 [Smutsia gigantea]|nr:hypothetical protein MC885_003229 [Smutsia gigantea]